MRCVAMPLTAPKAAPDRPLRVLTYNVRRCLGVDGRYSPERIADVIAECEADIVALQELDVGRLRSGGVDQASVIARRLGIDHVHFHPALKQGDELYGDAILTRSRSRLVRAGTLPSPVAWRRVETRGAVWAALEGSGLQVINTHLGLGRRERRLQAAELLGAEWLGQTEQAAPLVLLGDFNSMPGGRVYRAVCRDMRDANAGGRPTFPTFRPILRIDHIFVSPVVTLAGAQVHRSALARIASDHFPLHADLILPGELS
jgi:endonuclease/exonuclease/phosphatase family metal-dependent hydrolase